jgi:hypothetical protein
MSIEAPKPKSESHIHFSPMKWLRYVQETNIPIGNSFQDYRIALRKEPLHKTQIPEYPDLLREGRKIARPTREGTAEKIRYIPLDPANTVVVEEGHFAFGSSKHLSNSRFLVTYNISTCLAVIAYNPKCRAGLLGHASEQVNVADAVEMTTGLLDAKTVVLFGGLANTQYSFETVCIAEALLSRYGDKIKVIGRDTLRNGREDFSIGIDTKTGELFFPPDLIYSESASYLLRVGLPSLALAAGTTSNTCG